MTSKSTEMVDRVKNSVDKIEKLRQHFKDELSTGSFNNFCIYTTGSYARKEARACSDLDVFILYKNEKEECISRVDEIKILASIINATEKMNLPSFSKNGKYLKVLSLNEMKDKLGSPEDDYENYFTARMLLVLESKYLYNEAIYNSAIKEIIDSYLRDYQSHNDEFLATFLFNDIIRYWKTMCLNYEHSRNKPSDDQEKTIKQKIKNYKLKYSRMLTCFSTISLLTTIKHINLDEISTCLDLTPKERIKKIGDTRQDLQKFSDNVIKLYDKYLEKTNMTDKQLIEKFYNKEFRKISFKEAESFGEAVHDLVIECTKDTKHKRLILI